MLYLTIHELIGLEALMELEKDLGPHQLERCLKEPVELWQIEADKVDGPEGPIYTNIRRGKLLR